MSTAHLTFTGPQHAPVYDGGRYSVSGTVSRLGVAGAYKVVLFERKTGRRVASTWSAADGSYEINDLKENDYFAVAFDSNASRINDAVASVLTLVRT